LVAGSPRELSQHRCGNADRSVQERRIQTTDKGPQDDQQMVTVPRRPDAIRLMNGELSTVMSPRTVMPGPKTPRIFRDVAMPSVSRSQQNVMNLNANVAEVYQRLFDKSCRNSAAA